MKLIGVLLFGVGAVLLWLAFQGQTPDLSKGPVGLLKQIYDDLSSFLNHSHSSVTTPPSTPGSRGQSGLGPGAGAGAGGSGGGGGSW